MPSLYSCTSSWACTLVLEPLPNAPVKKSALLATVQALTGTTTKAAAAAIAMVLHLKWEEEAFGAELPSCLSPYSAIRACLRCR